MSEAFETGRAGRTFYDVGPRRSGVLPGICEAAIIVW
jgi:hypothetical protein